MARSPGRKVCRPERVLSIAPWNTAGAMTRDDQNRHDFKTQLGILGFSDLLLADAADDNPRCGDFEEIHKAATAALDLRARAFPARADTPQ